MADEINRLEKKAKKSLDEINSFIHWLEATRLEAENIQNDVVDQRSRLEEVDKTAKKVKKFVDGILKNGRD